ncbi:MAG TPA: hypothetical protein EYQ41_06595 [Micavibrio sp.]|nr:hypothetical protein [Micavibrio sp.]
MSWLSRAWDSTTEFVSDTYEGASAAIDVIMTDPGHAAAVFIDGVEHGITDVAGVVLGAVPDLIDYGSERLLGVNLYDGSAMTAISDGMMWAVDGVESLAGFEKPEIRGDGDEFLFGAGRVTGQVVGAVTVVGAGGAIMSAAQSTLQGAWWVASTGYKVTAVASTAVTGATVGTGALVAADVNYNDGRLTGGAIQGVSNWVIRQITGYESTGDLYEDFVPEEIKDAMDDFMAFMGDNPDIAKWASFGASMLVGGGLVSMIAGDSFIGKFVGLALVGAISWGVSNIFKDAATDAANENTAPEADGATPPAAEEQARAVMASAPRVSAPTLGMA